MDNEKTNPSEGGDCTNSSPSVCSTFRFWDDDYPEIAKLDRGYSLIGHPNGPALCNGDHICAIDTYDDDNVAMRQLIRDAQRKYREWSWELVKGTLKLPSFSSKA